MKKTILILASLALLCACQNSPASPETPKPEEKTEQTAQEQTTQEEAPKKEEAKTEEIAPEPKPEPAPEVKTYKNSELIGVWKNSKPTDEFDGHFVFKKNGKCGFQPFDEIETYKLEGDIINFVYSVDNTKSKAKIVELTPKTMKLQYEKPARTLSLTR